MRPVPNELAGLKARHSMAGIERETATLLTTLAPAVGMADEVSGGVVSLLDVALSAATSRRDLQQPLSSAGDAA